MKKRTIHRNISIPADRQSAKIAQPRERLFRFIPPFLSPHLPSVIVFPFLIVVAVRTNQLDIPLWASRSRSGLLS
jgi:hypothetical protein